MKGPDFFLVGAPKCGTTALALYLSGHPNVFMSPIKEPNFFNFDYSPRSQMGRTKYLSLFKDADPSRHKAVGEASVAYLMSETAVPEILKFDPKARLIVMLRNPLDLLPAWHGQLRSSLAENLADFEEAWRAEADRRRGRRVPLLCFEPKLLFYSDVGRLGAQMERLLARAPRENLRWMLFEDFAADPRAAYEGTLAFLGLPPDGRTEFPRVNESLEVRWPLLHLPFALAWRIQKGLQLAGLLGRNTDLVRRLKTFATRPAPRKPLREGFRKELADFYREDVLKLSGLLGRDLSGWLEPRKAGGAP